MKNRILVVDDEKEIADLVEIYLVSEKFDVIKCYDGDTAIDAIEHEKIDLAILDIMLPGISGLELCRRIRKKENYPVIMLTAKDSEVDKVTGLTIGADDYVTKPFGMVELLSRIRERLRSRNEQLVKIAFKKLGRLRLAACFRCKELCFPENRVPHLQLDRLVFLGIRRRNNVKPDQILRDPLLRALQRSSGRK